MDGIDIRLHNVTTEDNEGGLYRCDNCNELVESTIQLQRKCNPENELYVCLNCAKIIAYKILGGILGGP